MNLVETCAQEEQPRSEKMSWDLLIVGLLFIGFAVAGVHYKVMSRPLMGSYCNYTCPAQLQRADVRSLPPGYPGGVSESEAVGREYQLP